MGGVSYSPEGTHGGGRRLYLVLRFVDLGLRGMVVILLGDSTPSELIWEKIWSRVRTLGTTLGVYWGRVRSVPVTARP
jgi:hypothetical protein